MNSINGGTLTLFLLLMNFIISYLKKVQKMHSNCFHLAIEGGDLIKTISFYTDVLGCKLGPCEKDKWQDIDFYGNELTLHKSTPRKFKSHERTLHSVDMGAVCVPHFGIHLPWNVYEDVKVKILKVKQFYDPPYIRFQGLDTQQETFFVEDPNFNMIEIKSIQGTYYNNEDIYSFNNKTRKDAEANIQGELWET